MEMSLVQQVVPRHEDYAQSRASALHNVESTITELSGIFTHLATMVAHQGELAIRFFTFFLNIWQLKIQIVAVHYFFLLLIKTLVHVIVIKNCIIIYYSMWSYICLHVLAIKIKHVNCNLLWQDWWQHGWVIGKCWRSSQFFIEASQPNIIK